MNKSFLREKYKNKRSELTPGELETRSNRICEQVLANFQLERKTCSIFLPIDRHKEINTYALLERAISIGARMALPKCEENFILKHYQYEHPSQLSTNDLGIPEPQSGKLISNKLFDIVFVPLLAVDKIGNRVGYGKGFYDRFLKKCRPDCIFIGLHLFDELSDLIDVDNTDVSLHFCVTPNKIYRFEK